MKKADIQVIKGAKYEKHEKVVRMRFTDLNLKEVKEYAQKYSDELKDDGNMGFMNICFEIPDYGFRTGRMSDLGEPVNVWSFHSYNAIAKQMGVAEVYDHETIFPTVDLYFYKVSNKPTKGKGDGKSVIYCFYNCIKTLFTDEKLPDINHPYEFMKLYKLKKDEGFDIALIPRVEKRFNIRVDVVGDHTYISNKKASKKIKLLLEDGHYSILKDENIAKPKWWSKHDRIPLGHYQSDDKKSEICYDGKTTFTITAKEFYDMKYQWARESKYIILERPLKKSTDKDKLIKEMQEKFCKEADELLKETKGKINMYKTGRHKTTADALLYSRIKSLNLGVEKVEQDESEWIESCYNGGKLHVVPNQKFEKLHKLDVCSRYPFLLTTTKTMPIKRGEFKFVTDEIKAKKWVPKGIYRAIVEEGSDVFTYNELSYYTNEDINDAKNILHLNVEFIEDGEPNMLEYTGDKCVKLKQIFGEFVEYMFPLKQKGLAGAKKILTIPWGSCCQKNFRKVYRKFRDTELEIQLNEGEHIAKVTTLSKDGVRITVKNNTDLYKGSFPRMLPFLTAMGRAYMYRLLHDKMKHIKYIHTDGFLTDRVNLFKFVAKEGADLGSLVYEGFYENITLDKINTNYDEKYKFNKFS